MQSNHQRRVNPPASYSVSRMPSMFTNAENMTITGSSFRMTTTINTVNGPSLDVLHKRVAPNAILNAGGRADEVRCHPGTRKEVIGRIEKWADALDGRTPPMFWLSGPAGAGKSAIMQTIAERRNQHALPQANFFFFRGDSSRSQPSPLVPTLLHQIILVNPFLHETVATLLSTNPLIFDSTLEDQLTQLIAIILHAIKLSTSTYRPLILLIDGLDECDSEIKASQQRILLAFDRLFTKRPTACPFRLLVASRDESQIQAAFKKISSKCIHLYLDDQYSPANDIRDFVNSQFAEVRKTHPLAYTLDAAWPSVEDVINIVKKSSGQFIYAATVMRFIMDSSASPMLSLERVKGAARLASATKSPFAHLDAIYTYILSQADDQEALKDILHAHLLIVKFAKISYGLRGASEVPKSQLLDLLQIYNRKHTKPTILSCLADVRSIAIYTDRLLFHHASFPDYLLDSSRSADYFVDISAFSYKILPAVWKCIQLHDRYRWLEFGLSGIRHLGKLPPDLMQTLASSGFVWALFEPTNARCLAIFEAIHKLCIYDDDVNNFKRVIRQWAYKLPLDHDTLRQIKHIPFSRRYFEMAYAERNWVQAGVKATALSPETEFDHRESTLWLNNLLHCIHNNTYGHNAKLYKQLMKEWISWAIRNDISCDGLHDLPNTRWYIQGSIAEKWVARILKFGRSKK